jgi:hypothetical protein
MSDSSEKSATDPGIAAEERFVYENRIMLSNSVD